MASEAIHSWQHTVVDFQYSTEEYYKLLEAKIKERALPDIKTKTRNFKQGGMFSKNRLYLEISRKDYIFHVCAAPFGNDYFFSWYLREKLSFWQEWFSRIPGIGKYLVRQMQLKPYYQLDTEYMFKQSVHHAIGDTIDDILEPKGKRLSELDRQLK